MRKEREFFGATTLALKRAFVRFRFSRLRERENERTKERNRGEEEEEEGRSGRCFFLGGHQTRKGERTRTTLFRRWMKHDAKMKSKSSSSSAREKGRARLDAYRMRKKNSSVASVAETTRRTTTSSAADDTSGVVEKIEAEEMRGGKTKEEEKEEVKEVKEEATERRPLPPPPLPPPSRVEEKEVKEAHRPTFPASPSSPPVSDQSFANVREAASASASVKEKENEEQLHLLREHERLQKRALEEREEELEALRGRLIETNEMLSEERLRAEEMRETMKRVELRATTAEETLRAYASIVPEATTTAKKEPVEEKEKEEEHLIEIAQRRDENEHDVSERDVLKSARDAMRRERDQAIAKQRVAENKALEFEEELRDAEYTIMVLRQDVKAAEEQQRQDENEQGNDDDEEESRNEKQTKAEAALITELNSERRKNERLAEALHQSKEEISVLQQVSEKTKSMADKVETEADELENAIVAGEEKTRKLAKSLLEERRKVKNLRETVDIVARLVEKMTKLETDDVEGEDNADEIATNFVTESPFLRSRKTKSRLTNEEVLEESLREEDEMFDDETFFEKTIERVKNALDYKIDHLESFACEHVDKAKELGVLLTEADDEIVAQQEVVEQLQLQRDALLEEIYSRDEYLDSIERDLDQMLQTEGKLREEVSSKEKLVSEETAKNDKLMTLIEEQAMWTSSLNTKNGRDKENVDPSSSHEPLDNDDDTQNDTDRDRFERVKRDTDLILNYSKSAPTTPAKTRRIRSSNKNGINIAKDVYAPLLVTIEKRLHQLKDDRRKLAAFGGASLKQDHRESI